MLQRLFFIILFTTSIALFFTCDGETDSDNDGIPDNQDNCIEISNPEHISKGKIKLIINNSIIDDNIIPLDTTDKIINVKVTLVS